MTAFLLGVLLAHAPVYTYAEDGVLARVGDYTYEAADGVQVLYCITDPPPKLMMQCVIHTPDDKLLLANVTPTETKT